MFKKIGEFVFAVVVCAIAAYGVFHIVTGCVGGLPMPPPGQRVLITERENVRPEAFVTQQDGQAHAVVAPVETLPGAIGGLVKQKFAGKQAILTSEEWLNPTLIPGTTEVFLDVGGIYDILNPATSELVTGLAAKVLPAAVAPWVGPLAMFLPLLVPRVRKNAVNGIVRVIPGVKSPDPNDSGKIPDLNDFRQAIMDFAQAVTLQPPTKENYVRSDSQEIKPLNG